MQTLHARRALTMDSPILNPGAAAPPAEAHSKKHPFPARVLHNVLLTGGHSPKETWHTELSLAGSGLSYEAGDALGVLPNNLEPAVDELLNALHFDPDAQVPLPDGSLAPLRQALTSSYDLRTLTRPLLAKWCHYGRSPFLCAMAQTGDKHSLDDFARGREVIDLALGHPAQFPDPAAFVSGLRKLQPRLYSIASSPHAHPTEVHLTVAAVRYHAHGRSRQGACSCYIASRAPGETLGVFVHSNKAFRLPANPATPIIMIGAGTGIAPFRAFLEERRAAGAPGRNWLVFGNPHHATDFLYGEQLTAMQHAGSLHRLDLAWSRDQPHKVYVQHKLRDAAAELWAWLQDGACLYVCGDAHGMARDVDATLQQIACSQGGLAPDDAAAFYTSLRQQKRFLRDVY